MKQRNSGESFLHIWPKHGSGKLSSPGKKMLMAFAELWTFEAQALPTEKIQPALFNDELETNVPLNQGDLGFGIHCLFKNFPSYQLFQFDATLKNFKKMEKSMYTISSVAIWNRFLFFPLSFLLFFSQPAPQVWQFIPGPFGPDLSWHNSRVVMSWSMLELHGSWSDQCTGQARPGVLIRPILPRPSF